MSPTTPGLFLPFTFIIVVGRATDVPSSLAQYLMPILNASNTFQRAILPFLADCVACFNIFITDFAHIDNKCKI